MIKLLLDLSLRSLGLIKPLLQTSVGHDQILRLGFCGRDANLPPPQLSHVYHVLLLDESLVLQVVDQAEPVVLKQSQLVVHPSAGLFLAP